MFGSRRHRPNPPPLTSATANPNAATAAAAVFNKNRETSPSLSAAAAAAALRARPITPTNVAEVQTKRTLRRNASLSSSGSVQDLHGGRPGLQRRGSSGSMTERTFRSPSPHRPHPSGTNHRQTQSQSYTSSADMPPVPALPRDVDVGSIRSGSSVTQEPRRTPSLGLKTTPLRVASQRLGRDGTPSWFSAANVGDTANVRRTDPAMASPPSSPPQPQPVEDLSQDNQQRPSSRSSINFSYPARMRVGSPPVSPVDHRGSMEIPHQQMQPQEHVSRQQPRDRQVRRVSSELGTQSTGAGSETSLVYDPNSRRMVSRSSLVEQSIIAASEKPTKPRRKKQQAPARAGSHLAQGTMGRTTTQVQTMPTTVHHVEEPEQTIAETQPQHLASDTVARGFQEYQDEPAVKALIHSPRTEAKKIEQQHLEGSPQRRAEDVDTTKTPHLQESMRSPPAIRRQPSVVKEEPEPESELESAQYQPALKPVGSIVHGQTLQSVPLVSMPSGAGQSTEFMPTAPSPPAQSSSVPPGDSMPTVIPAPRLMERSEPRVVAVHPPPLQQVRQERTHSSSPVRQAHFGPVSESLMVKHSPPSRSISPRKSALKQHSPSRGASPSDDTSEASTSIQPPEEHITRKKSVRVSFDEGSNVVVGESAPAQDAESPVVPSPQNTTAHRPWYSNIGRSKKKEFVPLEDDEVMQPRPALPSFGSVRGKKPREASPVVEERPLVRPMLEVTNSPPLPATPVLVPADDFKPEAGSMGPSSDYVIGALLQQEHDQLTRNPANISRFREPLPPVVTSIEGSGYVSDTSESEASEPEPLAQENNFVESESAQIIPTSSEERANVPIREDFGADDSQSSAQEDERVYEAIIPSISVTQATPPPKRSRASTNHLDVPGGFPDDESDVSTARTSRSTTPTVAQGRNQRPEELATEPTTQGYSSHPAVLATPIVVVESSDSESSIYSDAYEDLSDIEGDGFQSLNAVLEAPAVKPIQEPRGQITHQSAPSQIEEAPPAQPQQFMSELSAASTVVENQTAVLPADDWEKAKAFWRSLTEEKRALLEREAREEAAAEADLEEHEAAMAKPKKKKSLERRNSERKALALHMAQQMMAQQQRQQKQDILPTPDRSYMIKPGTKWSEPGTALATTMRASMRNSTPHHQHHEPPSSAVPDEMPRLRKSMRPKSSTTRSADPLQPGSRPSISKTERHMSFPPLGSAPVALSKAARRASEMGPSASTASAASAAMTNYYPPSSSKIKLRRRGSDSSESSFRRARSALAGQGFGFRKSMRNSAPPTQPAEESSGKKLLRALSPSGSPFRKPMTAESPQSTTHMRQTLRGSPVEHKSSGIRMPSFGLSSSGNRNTGKRASAGKTRRLGFASRLNDSSDEDVAPTSQFRSRFEDSSDEDDISPMPLGLPKTMRSGASAMAGHRRNQHSSASSALPEEQESEELPDSSDEEKHLDGLGKKAQLTKDTVRRSGSGRGTIASPQAAPNVGGDSRTSSSKRGSFMNALRRKKPDAQSKISRPEMLESAARRDTKLERSVGKLRDIRGYTGEDDGEDNLEDEQQPVVMTQQPASPKLRKHVVGLPASTSKPAWPLSTEQNSISAENDAATDDFVPSAGLGIAYDEKDPIEELRRPSTSGNLGTRTLSGYSGSGAQPGFLQRRTVSSGVLSLDTTELGEAGKKKKKFGALRRMFRLQ